MASYNKPYILPLYGGEVYSCWRIAKVNKPRCVTGSLGGSNKIVKVFFNAYVMSCIIGVYAKLLCKSTLSAKEHYAA